MANLQTKYLGIEIPNPVIVGACALSTRLDVIKKIADAGAGGLVIKSLFEEQIQIERGQIDAIRDGMDNVFAEAITLFPKVEHSGAKEHVYWVKKARKAVTIPLFGSLNCVNLENWVDYSRQLAEAGIDGLELNFYSPALEPTVSAGDVEKREVEIVSKVRDAIKIPVSVKLHPYYTNLLNHVTNLENAGANGFVLFNRLFQPDIDMVSETKLARVNLTEQRDTLLPLKWMALLRERVEGTLIASTGITSGSDAAKMILAGADAVQVVSVLYRMGLPEIGKILTDLQNWMNQRKYEDLAAFRGKVAKGKADDLWSFERGQYIKAILGFE